MTHEHLLGGCSPTPLAHYLKALGILRLVAEQKDPDAAGCWQGEQFLLRSVLNRDELDKFFLEEYQPTPIVAPWNGGSGFYFQEEKRKEKDPLTGKRLKTGIRNQPTEATKIVERIMASQCKRLDQYRLVLHASKRIVQAFRFLEAPKDEEKYGLILSLRGILPDNALHWFDAAVLLFSETNDFKCPPLLGSGGNDGNLDFTNNFMQRLMELLDADDKGKTNSKSISWLKGSLNGEAAFGLVSKAIGQFAPGNIGGPNAANGFDADSLINPWDFVLMMEGALLFAGAATRRMESSDNASLSYPFTVRMTNAGSGNIADEVKSRDEIWTPLWRNKVTLAELRLLLSEGRVTVGRHAARDGLDFTRAVSGFGVDRGISDFQRYAFLMRSGKAYLATPLARIHVSRNPQADLLLHLDRDGWLDRLRRFARDNNAPGRIQQIVHRLENEIFSLTQRGGREILQNIIKLLGEVQLVNAASAKAREAVSPIPKLGPEWVTEADDGSPEFRLACSLAGMDSMRNYIEPVKRNEKTRRMEWAPGNKMAVWGGGDLANNLLRVLDRRLLEAQRNQQEDMPFAGQPSADLAAVMAFLRAETDDKRIAELFTGIVNVDLPKTMSRREVDSEEPSTAFCLFKPLFTPTSLLQQVGLLPENSNLPLPRQIVSLLKSDNHEQTGRAIDIAWRRLQIAGMKVPTHPRKPPSIVGLVAPRLTVALMIPLAKGDLVRICAPLMPSQKAN